MTTLPRNVWTRTTSAPKSPDTGDRAAPLASVLREIPALRERYGITRIADTTHLDRIGIPTMSAFVPRSRDVLGVYSGKGRTRDEALVSTVMEAVERQVCVAYDPPTVRKLPHEIERHVDLREVGYDGPADRALRCVAARNLLTGEPIAIPLGLANPFADAANFPNWTTNGLAAGSTLIEAQYHALLEVVERHRWSQTEIELGAWRRYLRVAYGEMIGIPRDAPDPADDPADAEIAFPTGDPDVDALAGAITAAGLALRVFALADGAWPVTMLSCVHEPEAKHVMVHSGVACSWSPRRAAIGAITEAASSRAIVIQGAREDLVRTHGSRAPARKGRPLDRVPAGRWFFDVPAPRIAFSDLPDRASDDLAFDVQRLLDVVSAYGLRCVALIDLSPPDRIVHVVRIVAPGLERFVVDGSITRRTQRRLAPSFTFAAG